MTTIVAAPEAGPDAVEDDTRSLRRALLVALGRLDTGPERALDGLTAAAAAATGCPLALLRVDGDGLEPWFVASHGFFDPPSRLAAVHALVRADTFVERAARAAGEPMDLGLARTGLGYAAGEPLCVERRLVGTLAVADFAPRAAMPALPRHALRGLADAAEALFAARRPGTEAHAQALRRRQALLSRISHEMRTPLNAVLGFAQLLQTEPPLAGTRAASWLQEIDDASRQLLSLVDEMLRLGRQDP